MTNKTLMTLKLFLLCGTLASLCTGCSRFSKSARDNAEVIAAEESGITLTIETDKDSYRPGEAIIVTATLANESEVPVRLRGLDGETASFYFGEPGSPRRVERKAVMSKAEAKKLRDQGSEVESLGPGDSRERRFMLARMTENSGTFVAQSHVDPFMGPEQKETGKVYSNLVTYTVAGDPMFTRDKMGLIMKTDAIDVARAAAPGPVNAADAVLIEDEQGLYRWWVNVDYRDGAGQVRRAAWLVNPYSGTVSAEAKPFTEEMKQDGRIRVVPHASRGGKVNTEPVGD